MAKSETGKGEAIVSESSKASTRRCNCEVHTYRGVPVHANTCPLVGYRSYGTAEDRKKPRTFQEDCIHWWGRELIGQFAHSCYDGDDLPIDETCIAEFECCAETFKTSQGFPFDAAGGIEALRKLKELHGQ